MKVGLTGRNAVAMTVRVFESTLTPALSSVGEGERKVSLSHSVRAPARSDRHV